jgi:hypothetical protein
LLISYDQNEESLKRNLLIDIDHSKGIVLSSVYFFIDDKSFYSSLFNAFNSDIQQSKIIFAFIDKSLNQINTYFSGKFL